MSSNDDPKTNGADSDAHLPSPSATTHTIPHILLFFILGMAASMILGWLIFPQLLYSQKNQPIDFNHRLHMELVDQGCQSCHFFREDGTFSGSPKLAQCISCHDQRLGLSENEKIFFEEYVAKDREVPWLVYARQPDCVFFSHAAHVEGARMDCVTCHGNTGTSESLRPYEENRLTGYSRDIWGRKISGLKVNSWDRMKMSDCAKCHAQYADIHDSSEQTRRDACFVCHK
ncbi:menaquinone reductase multiheme cytochrome c subunit QrcA [Desulfatitalea alkaliphila]|uniref:Cytochrome c family protein n=1 Tax=Desulfatitalea alkaliphila TaxID=2929485 RepID=A0AA41URA0_9BACT|nr:menaquinone reductase multiheme cytochrome c subunit QrcA [Desulfatitalea alkaliphila]MCJ8502153.1 cytochrome c family protein [Desulfatitalea alkaliphila]